MDLISNPNLKICYTYEDSSFIVVKINTEISLLVDCALRTKVDQFSKVLGAHGITDDLKEWSHQILDYILWSRKLNR
jgi:hypothetical protein